MASYGNTVLTSAGIDLVKRVIARTATFEITRVATSSDSRLVNADISTIEAMTALPSVTQTGKVTAFDKSSDKQVGLKCEFTNQGLTNQYDICGVGIYAKEAGKSEILFAVAPAKEPETMPAKPDDQSALFTFSLTVYMAVGQASAMSITATTEGVVKSINGTIKPDANGNVTLPYYSQAEVDQKVSSLSGRIDSKVSQTADAIRADLTNAKGDISSLQQTANGLTSTVSNLHAGDRNLARGVASSKDWVVFQGFNNYENYSYWNLVEYSLETLKAGDKVTFGITMKNEGVTSGTMVFAQFGDFSQWTRDDSGISPAGNVTNFVPNGAEKALTYTITITDGMLNGNSRYNVGVRTDNVPAGGKLSFRYAFVKKGNMATDWTPAPEDTDQAISKVSQTADAIRADLTNTKGDISSLQQTADSLTSTVGQMPAKWQQAINDKVSAMSITATTEGAGAHNATYRGANLGGALSGAQAAAIKAGTFDELFVGDYWSIGEVNYRIAAFDYYFNAGDTPCTTHHVVVVPDTPLYDAKMNETDTTVGAYVGSEMYTKGLSKAKATITAAFGKAHLLTHRNYLQNACTNGVPTGAAWFDSTVELMTEQNVYGNQVMGALPSGGTVNPWDANGNHNSLIDKSQFPLFAFRPDLISNHSWFWLRTVVSAAAFALVAGDGVAHLAGGAYSGGVRPAFSIC